MVVARVIVTVVAAEMIVPVVVMEVIVANVAANDSVAHVSAGNQNVNRARFVPGRNTDVFVVRRADQYSFGAAKARGAVFVDCIDEGAFIVSWDQNRFSARFVMFRYPALQRPGLQANPADRRSTT